MLTPFGVSNTLEWSMLHRAKRLVFSQYLLRYAALLLITGCAFIPARTSTTQYRFDSWTTDNGLPQVSVNSILQTRDGFIWLTTFGGLVRYDGLRFQVFNTGNTKGLRASRFVRMVEDREGFLWISTEGQGLIRYKDGEFTTFNTENGLPNNYLTQILADGNGDLMIEVMLDRFRWNGLGFEKVVEPNEPRASRLQLTKTGSWYFEGNQLKKFKDGEIVETIQMEGRVLRVFEDSTGRLWIAIDGKDTLFTYKDWTLTEFRASEGHPEFRMGVVMEDAAGNIWFGAFDSIYRFDGTKFTKFAPSDGLVRGATTALYQDREGTIWVGTNGGLSRLTRRAITTYSQPEGLAGDNVYPVYEDTDGKIWIGSWSGLTVYENGAFRDVGKEYGVEKQLIYSLLRDRKGNLWIGTWSGLIMPPQNTAPRPSWNILSDPNIRAIYEDRAGNIWFGSSTGVVKFDGETYTPYDNTNGFPAKGTYVFHEDRNGTLWIGTDAGLVSYRDGVFTNNDKNGVSPNIVRAIYEDNDGTLWIGMYDSGLYRYRDGRFTHFTSEHGLFDNGVFQIVEDDQGNFWISCNLGIYRIRKSELEDQAAGRIREITSVLYNKRDGMLNSECNGGNQNAGLRAKDGRIWFPTQQGVAVLDPRTVPINNSPPPVVIESLIVDTKPINQYRPVQIEPGQSALEIHYSGLSFINPELVKFKYKLEGLDPEWIDAQTRRTAYYSHIPPGTYTFKVLAANRDGVWNEQGASITISVLPPFYRTWWFFIVAVILVTLMILTLYYRRINMLKRAHAAQEAFALKLIESQERERKRIAAELHDSLGQSLVLIKNWALLGIKAESQQRSPKANLDEISATASDAIKEVREISYNLGPYQLDRLGLRKTIEEMVQKVEDSSSTNFTAKIGEIDRCLERDAEVSFFRIVQEAVNNVARHSGAKSAALSIEKEGEQLILNVRDDGKGFDPVVTERGFGLLGMSERVGLLRGELSVRSEVGKGVDIRVVLPCSNGSNNGHGKQ